MAHRLVFRRKWAQGGTRSGGRGLDRRAAHHRQRIHRRHGKIQRDELHGNPAAQDNTGSTSHHADRRKFEGCDFWRSHMKQHHTVMLTYDRIEKVDVDLGIDNLRSLYKSGCMNEQFVKWIPERFAMQVSFKPGDTVAADKAIETCIIGLYRIIPKSRVANMQIWIDGETIPQIVA